MAETSGDNIVSATTGTVTLVSNQGDLGNHVKIVNDEYEAVYAHCSQILVQEGSQINQGDVIATVGSTGNSTGNHLHFEVDLNGDPVSAWPYLNAE